MRSRISTRASTGVSKFETLEDRRLLAGNVTVTYVPATDTFQVIGDNKSNGVALTVDGSTFGIAALPGTTVNGGTFVPIYGTGGGIHFDMGNGDDTVVLNTSVFDDGVPVSIETGNGNDTVSVSDWIFNNTSLTISTGNGNDSVQLEHVALLNNGSLKVNTGNGKDSIAFSGPNSADATSTIDLQTGHGKDGVTGLETLFNEGTLTIT